MYTNDSLGNWARIARATVSPPTPESKIPIGASFMTIEPTLHFDSLTLAQYKRRAQGAHRHHVALATLTKLSA